MQGTMTKKLVLYTFPPVANSYSMSPFALKTESFLRVNNISYEKCYTSSFGKNKTIPYLRVFNDEQDDGSYEELSDSNQIIARLTEDPDFDTSKGEENLSKEQKAIGKACLRMLEEHTSQVGFYYRYALNMHNFTEATQLRERLFMAEKSKLGAFIFKMFIKKMPPAWMKKAEARGFVRYGNPDIVCEMACEDLSVLEDLMPGDGKNYFFGRSHPGALDCTVFGHLSQFLYIPMGSPFQKYLEESCPNLIRFMANFKNKVFPDWEALLEEQPNEAFSHDNPRMQKMAKLKKVAILGGTLMVAAVGIGISFVFTPTSSKDV